MYCVLRLSTQIFQWPCLVLSCCIILVVNRLISIHRFFFSQKFSLSVYICYLLDVICKVTALLGENIMISAFVAYWRHFSSRIFIHISTPQFLCFQMLSYWCSGWMCFSFWHNIMVLKRHLCSYFFSCKKRVIT